MTTLTKGQRVRLRRKGDTGDWCNGDVILASANGKSVACSLSGAVRTGSDGLIAGVIPLMVDYDTETVMGLDATEYEMEVQ